MQVAFNSSMFVCERLLGRMEWGLVAKRACLDYVREDRMDAVAKCVCVCACVCKHVLFSMGAVIHNMSYAALQVCAQPDGLLHPIGHIGCTCHRGAWKTMSIGAFSVVLVCKMVMWKRTGGTHSSIWVLSLFRV